MNKLLEVDSNTKIVDVTILVERLVKEDLFTFENALLSELRGSIEKLKVIKENKSFKK